MSIVPKTKREKNVQTSLKLALEKIPGFRNTSVLSTVLSYIFADSITSSYGTSTNFVFVAERQGSPRNFRKELGGKGGGLRGRREADTDRP